MSLTRQASSKSSIDITAHEWFSFGTANPVQSPEQVQFDHIIGVIDTILVDEQFAELQNNFFDCHYSEFEDKEENSFKSMIIFQDYIRLIEGILVSAITTHFPEFSMNEFMPLCQRYLNHHQEEGDQGYDGGDVFEMLSSLTDFNEFKSMMISFRKNREGQALDLSDLIVTRPVYN